MIEQRERRATMRSAAAEEPADETNAPDGLILQSQRDIARSVAYMAEQMRDANRATQFLIKENAVLRSRQAERQDLAREMLMQQRAGIAGRIEALATQVSCVVQQQAAIIDALSAFSSSVDMPPPVAFARRESLLVDKVVDMQPFDRRESTYEEIIGMMRQNSCCDGDAPKE